MKQILVPVDYSDLAAAVIQYTARIAIQFQSRVHIVHIETPVPSFVGNEIGPQVLSPEQRAEEAMQQQADLKAMAMHLQEKGIETTWELLQGAITDTIIEKAIAIKAELIIVGAHSHGIIYRAFIGSVSTGVLKHAPCPVLVIPERPLSALAE